MVKTVVLGWDSATFDVIDPLLEQGRLPVLKELIEGGHRAPLRSTWPPMTDCAWTSAFTGLNPGGHGIFGSWYRAPGAYECRYFSSRDRLASSVWDLAPETRWLVWNVPMTFPASKVNGVMVSGYGAPPGSRFCEPAEFQNELQKRWPLDDILDRAPHGSLEDFRTDLIRGLEVQPQAMTWAAERVDAECVVAVWPHVDRAQHFFWRRRGTNDPLAGAVDDVYEAMDRATGELVEAWPDADLLVVSDHGAGDLKGDVNVGKWLAENGYARFGEKSGSSLADIAWKLPPSVRKLGRRLAPKTARKTMSATLAGQLGSFEWSETKAFLGFHSDVWLNIADREPLGCVPPEEADGLRDEIAAGFLELTDPRSEEPVFAAAHKREDIYSGPAVDLAPDLILDSWSAGYRVAPARDAKGDVVGEPRKLSGVREAWSSDHRPLGIFVAGGPNIASGTSDELSLYDVCPTTLALIDAAIPAGLDGRPAESVIKGEFLEGHPVRTRAEQDSITQAKAEEYSAEEAAAVAEHLKDLGYIE